ncbi:MAG: ABC transporter ATP-binding protein [Candidatus Melainabacteria bacterium]|nr:ABC transporter ATP-binding protein [Candidatus Melainabacteria bacterium]
MIEIQNTATAKKTSTNAVEVINVTKKFGNSVAANQINLSIEEGEFFSFLGPSGCGKTTLLQQQRVALARAVINNPSVLLLDEPLSALDPQIREEMQVELARLQKRLNMTFIMVTHDQNEALALSSRVAVFCQGNLEQVGTPEQIFEHPATTFVAKFIGQTNLLPGLVVDYLDDAYCISICSEAAVLKVPARLSGLSVGSETIVWVKPHGIQLFNHDSAPLAVAGNVLEGAISGRMYQGTTTEYLVRLQDGSELRVSVLNSANYRTPMFEIGANVLAYIPPDSCALIT